MNKHLRLICLAAILGGFTAVGNVVVTPVVAQQEDQQRYQQITLKQQLEFGLRARTPQEFAYVNTVTTMVDNSQLPRRIVNMAYLWSRKKSRYPYPYFSRALVILAAREGYTVPNGPY